MSGPCTPWTTAEDVLDSECCSIEGTDPDAIAPAVAAAIDLLYRLSGKRYSGECEATVRPCSERICPGPWARWENALNRGCGCGAIYRVPLAGGAREVLEVTIDGDAVDPVTYELNEGMWLDRVNDPADPLTNLNWPSCENKRLPLSEVGTFGITYTFGLDPPATALQAVTELACAVHVTCTSDDPGDCMLPSGVTQIDRQGIKISLQGFSAWGLVGDIWRTGLPLVDGFLNAVNPSGSRAGRAQVWSPDLWHYPRLVTPSGS